jgi:hypothetical protein
MSIVCAERIALLTGVPVNEKTKVLARTMTSILADMLGVKQFTKHTVELEEVRLTGDRSSIVLRSFPAEDIEIFDFHDPTKQLEAEFRADTYDFRRFHLVDNGQKKYFRSDKVYATYQAGYEPMQIIVENNPENDDTMTVIKNCVSKEYTFKTNASGSPNIQIGADENETATNIANKLGGTAEDNVVTLPEGFSSGTSEAVEIINFAIPDDLKLCVAYMVAGADSARLQGEGVLKYSLGGKSLDFRSETEASYMHDIVNKYGLKYNRANIIC